MCRVIRIEATLEKLVSKKYQMRIRGLAPLNHLRQLNDRVIAVLPSVEKTKLLGKSGGVGGNLRYR
jgi:hypothetical protein